ncbi:two-component sensor histidine kinase, partial [Streptomyces albogriseolus]
MSTLDRARCTVRAHPLALDASVAAGVLVCMVAGSFVDPRGDN